MVRISKIKQRYNRCPKKRKPPSKKTGPKKDNLPSGYREHENALERDLSKTAFVPKIK